VSLDLNYRKGLWRWGEKGREVLGDLMGLADVVITNESHLRLVLDDATPFSALDSGALEALSEIVLRQYPRVSKLALTVRADPEDGRGHWTGCLAGPDGFLSGQVYPTVGVVDRIGAGDAFVAGLIYGSSAFPTDREALDFAIAAGYLKHSIPGDFLRATVDEVAAVAAGNTGSGRIDR
jgi:2-dehydro-3-deoxygluconokinase